MDARLLAFTAIWVALILCAVPVHGRDSCLHDSCSFYESDVLLTSGNYHQSRVVRALAGAELYVNASLLACVTAIGQECRVTVMLVTSNQLQQVKSIGVANLTSINAPFLKKGVNFFTDVTEALAFKLYFQKHGGDYMLAFYLSPTPGSSSISVRLAYGAKFDYDVCHGLVGGLVGIYLIIVALFACGLIITSNFRREVSLRAQNAVEGLEDRHQKRVQKYREEKRLRERKEEASWFNAPFIPICYRKCECCSLMTQPKYPFFPYHWLFTHDWLSFIRPAPDEQLSRWNKLLVILTKVIVGMILLAVWIQPIIEASAVLSATSLPDAWKEIVAEMFSKSFAIWIVEELIGIFYPWFLLRAQHKGNQRNEISIGGTSYEVNDPLRQTSKITSLFLLILREIGSFVLLALVLLLLFALHSVRDYLSCRYVESVIIQLFVLEFYRLFFPGILASWLLYMLRNTWGAPPPAQDAPIEDAEVRAFATADDYEPTASINSAPLGDLSFKR